MELREFPRFEYVWRGYNGTIGCEVRGARCEVRGARGTERTPFPAEATESCFFVRAVL